jgi:hypothetical protein
MLKTRLQYALYCGSLCVLGILWDLFVLSRLPTYEIFASGDGGVKALLVKQFARGDWGTHLLLPGPDWVQALWRQGLHPIEPPFAYPDGSNFTLGFSANFPALSVPGYVLLGGFGLYVVPILSLVLLWILFYRTLRTLEIPPHLSVAFLAMLIFSTHLTLYGAMFWEHTLGTLLAFFGVAFIATIDTNGWNTRRAVLYGGLCGLGTMIRPEILSLIATLGVLSLASWREPRRALYFAFIAGMISGTAAFFLSNVVLYGGPLGAHGTQMEIQTWMERLLLALANAKGLVRGLIEHAPYIGFALIALPIVLRRTRIMKTRALHRLLWAVFGFLFLIPFVVPNAGGLQYGPRYLLIITPAIVLICAILTTELMVTKLNIVRRGLIGLLVLLAITGIGINGYRETFRLIDHYTNDEASAPLAIRDSGTTIIAINKSSIAQQLMGAVPEKSFFLTTTGADLETLAHAAQAFGENAFLFIEYHSQRPEPGLYQPDLMYHPKLKLTMIGIYGMFKIYKVTLTAT